MASLSSVSVDPNKFFKKSVLHVNIQIKGLKLLKIRFWIGIKLLKIVSFILPFKSVDYFEDITDETAPGERI